MARRNSYLSMTGDDLRAARVLTLAVKFFGAAGPVPSSTIAAELYPGLDQDSFRRQYLRDRELLATFGLVIREAGSDGDDTLWQVDERSSYVTGEELSAEDARMLYVLCHDMAFDQAFPYRDELRLALAKISRMYRGTAIPHNDDTTPAEHRALATLVSAMSARHGVRMTYTDAKGNRSERTVAPLGSFGLRGRTYFVASRIEKDGTLTPDTVRTFRLDRIGKAKELAGISYQVPLDFSVSDYERLPFQIGDTIDLATLLVPDEREKELSRAMDSHGSLGEREGSPVWQVPYSDERLLASWCIATQVVPLSPNGLVDAYERILVGAAGSDAYDPLLAEMGASIPTDKTRRRTGRTGSVGVARQLVALASSLTREGEVITADNIATTLGIDYDDARHLISLVSLGSGESIDYLPVILGDQDEEVSLMEGAALSARRVRLTRAETIALSAALAELGVGQDDPLVQTLNASYASPAFSVDDIARSLEAPSSANDGHTLRVCSQAIAQGRALAFSYRPVTGEAPSSRRVWPQMVRRGDDSWYLDAYDLVKHADRVFRIDRMDDVHEVRVPQGSMPQEKQQTERQVVVRFDDPAYLELFHWDGVELLSRDHYGCVVRMPQYGGPWLARHLAACGGTVQVNDSELAVEIVRVAKTMIS